MQKGGTMYRLTGFEQQEQELFGMVAGDLKKRALKSMIKTLREFTHQHFPGRTEGHAHYRQVLTKVRKALLFHAETGDQAAV